MKSQNILKFFIVFSMYFLEFHSFSMVFPMFSRRLENAYPVYFKGYETISEIVLSYLNRFENLWTLGRGGSYFYGHLHDFVTDGFEVVNSMINSDTGKIKPEPQTTSF